MAEIILQHPLYNGTGALYTYYRTVPGYTCLVGCAARQAGGSMLR
jgi:hypothetical protein